MAKIQDYTDEERQLTVADAYWNCKRFLVDIRKHAPPAVHFMFEGYTSQTAANEGAKPVAEKTVVIDNPATVQQFLILHFQGTRLDQLAYVAAGLQNTFPDATDDVVDQTVIDALEELQNP